MSAITNKSLRVLTLPDLRVKGIPWSRTHLGRLIERGEFPAPFRLGAMTLAWRESDIDEWIAERIAAGNTISEDVRAAAVKAAKARHAGGR
jgi:prophage regulatory protein